MNTIIVRVRCRPDDNGEEHPSRSLVEKGWRFDLELDACRADGTFATEVEVCDRPLLSGDEAEIVLAVWVPDSHIHFFTPGAHGRLKRAQYDVAHCVLLESPRSWADFKAQQRIYPR